MARWTRPAAVVFVALVVAAACGKSTTTTATTASTVSGVTTTTGPTSKAALTSCMVTDTGGIDDRSFNASSYKGLTDAKAADPNIMTSFLQSKAQSDYVPNINALIAQKCGIIVTVGFLMGDATKAAAAANPTQIFAIVDYGYAPPLTNVKALIFNTAQAGFLGGYLAAGMSKSGSVATFGGLKLPTVTIYMDGYAEGVAYYNSKHNTQVKVLGWDEKAQNGTFTGDFTDQTKGKNVTQTFIQQGADIIFPVAGNVGLGAAAAVQQNGAGVHMLWVDTDGCVSAPQYCSLFISSVEKGIAVAVKQGVIDAANGTFKGGNYIGTLANNGVGLAPLDKSVPASLSSELDTVKQAIISGSITITSPSQPTS